MLSLDISRWGIFYGANGNSPYWEGHERLDVVQSRDNLIDYFISRSEHYYRITDDTEPKWINPTEKPCVLFFHDEATFRSGEQCSKRWKIVGHETFHSKGF